MTIQEAVKQHKLDRRHKWFSFCGNVVYAEKYKDTCIECDGLKCQKCGYTGYRNSSFPNPAIDKKTGNPIKITDPDFTYYTKHS